jgi:predicted lipoprotein with Yx(FWY)xxD motif
MTRTRPAWAMLAVAALALAGCGGSNDGSTTAGAESAGGGEKAPKSRPTRISSGRPNAVQPVLVDERGYTIYVFKGDAPGGGKSACYGKCAEAWPPVTTTGKPQVWGRAEIQASLLGTIPRGDGELQVTYAGWPLYTLKGEPPTETKGWAVKAFGNRWYLLHVNGKLYRR